MINELTKFNEILKEDKFANMQNQFIHSMVGPSFEKRYGNKSLEDINNDSPTWNKFDMLYGLNRLLDFEDKNIPFYRIYSDVEIKKDKELDEIGFTYFKAKNKISKTYAILLSGGAFGAVCNLCEAYPVATRLNELGIDAFVLTYQTARASSFIKGLFPSPIEEISRTINYIKEHNELFNEDVDNYFLVGFSAGTTISATYGLTNVGYKKYNQVKPKALLLVYPLISFNQIPDDNKAKSIFINGVFGTGKGKKGLEKYDVMINVNNEYPTTYMVVANDDDTVPINGPDEFKEKLDSLNVKNYVERVEKGGHGFGLGTYSDAKGYVERFLKFIGE